ncbi:MAG: class I tRNA ligase family protein, partial [Bacteroidaceae bacterium]|nr:class I tRNA ligase family protein [Bacteroidaceae bacterium]
LCEQGRNFCNKIWNAFRLVRGWEVSDAIEQPATSALAIQWFGAQMRKSAAEMADLFTKYRLSEALMEVYRLFWDEFSSWYLEMVKPAYQQPIDATTYAATIGFFDDLLHLLHPFMPFISEELWQHIDERKEGESISVSPQNIAAPLADDAQLITDIEHIKGIISGVRAARAQKGLSPREALPLSMVGDNQFVAYDQLLIKMANISELTSVAEAQGAGYSTFMVGTTQYGLYLGDVVDVEAEKEAARAELEHLRRFLKSIQGKLSNERFVSGAPEAVVALERKKEADTLAKIAALEAKL